MWGWLSEASTRASRSKRARRSGSLAKTSRQDLDRDVATELGVARAIDLAHPAGAEAAPGPDTRRAAAPSGRTRRRRSPSAPPPPALSPSETPASTGCASNDSTSRRNGSSPAHASATNAARSLPHRVPAPRDRVRNLPPTVSVHAVGCVKSGFLREARRQHLFIPSSRSNRATLRSVAVAQPVTPLCQERKFRKISFDARKTTTSLVPRRREGTDDGRSSLPVRSSRSVGSSPSCRSPLVDKSPRLRRSFARASRSAVPPCCRPW